MSCFVVLISQPMKQLFLFLIVITPCLAFAQKRELEERIAKEEVPTNARKWIADAYELPLRLKWYLEQGDQGMSYEAKCKSDGAWHSVEFGANGELQDVEVKISQENLADSVETDILAFLEARFDRFKIHKIQLQASGNPDSVRQWVKDRAAEVTIRYEIELHGKLARENTLYEALFDSEGHYLNMREIILRTSDNLTY